MVVEAAGYRNGRALCLVRVGEGCDVMSCAVLVACSMAILLTKMGFNGGVSGVDGLSWMGNRL